MSIASEINRINTNISAAYDAAEAKGATMPATENSANLADTVASIPQGSGGALEEKEVNFFDYDGTLLYSYSKAEAASLASLPSLPTHEGLTAQGWTHTFEQIQAFAVSDRPFLEVGATFITDDGSTRLYFEVPDVIGIKLSLSLTISGNLALDIDWGDSSPVETVTTTATLSHTMNVSHTNVMVKIAPTGTGTYTFSLLNNPPYSLYVFLQKAEIGSNVSSLPSFSSLYYLEYITIPQGIANSISPSTFLSCYSLISCVLPIGMESIGANAFSSCYQLRRLIIPDSVMSIGDYSIQNCYSLKSLVIPERISIIANTMIRQCYILKKISLPNIVQIENYGISNNLCLNLILPSTVRQIGDSGISSCDIRELDIPDGVTQISNRMCYNNQKLQKVTIPDSVTSIGNNSFQLCTCLIQIAIPSSVTSIGTAAFSNCYNLLIIDISGYTDPNNLPTLVNYNAFPTNASMIIYVADQTMLDAFKTGTNWSRLNAYYKIKGA